MDITNNQMFLQDDKLLKMLSLNNVVLFVFQSVQPLSVWCWFYWECWARSMAVLVSAPATVTPLTALLLASSL